MAAVPEPHEDRQVQLLRDLEEEYASIEGDIVQVGDGAWAIHGVIPVDGDVLMAEFQTYDEARSVLDSVTGDGSSLGTAGSLPGADR